MTTTELTLETLDQRVNALAQDVKQLKTQVEVKPLPKPRKTATPPEHEELIAEMIAEGFIVEPSLEWLAWGKELQAEWEALPLVERQAAEEDLRTLWLDPPASELISKMREGWYPDESEWVA